MKIDLHVHSKYSKRPPVWILKKIGSPESFTEPSDIYRIARERGMDAVTITDHNRIDGALEIVHLPGTFVSEEVTTYFPEDGCKLHVLALNITEKQHADIQKVRENVFELVDYLTAEQVVHVLAHPLYRVNGRLTAAHFEKLLLLFRHFELNGARSSESNDCLRTILQRLTPDMITRLADRHGIAPKHEKPWEKVLTGGSDDHSSLHIAGTHTDIAAVGSTAAALMEGLRRGRTKVVSDPADPVTMAHNFYSIAYQFYRDKFDLDRYAKKDVLIHFLDRTLRNQPEEARDDLRSRLYFFFNHRKMKRSVADMSASLFDLLRRETYKLLTANPDLMQLARGSDADDRKPEKRWFDFVNQVVNRAFSHFGNRLMDHLSGANVFNIFNSLGSAGGLYTLMAPCFVSYSLFAEDRRFSDSMSDHFSLNPPGSGRQPVRVAHFTDTFYDVNGVALTLQQQVQSALRNHKQLEVITCDTGAHETLPGIRNFKPVGVYELPEYPELQVFYPPLLDMLDYCYTNKFTRIHSATPGPIGLAALAIARILRLPVYGTYHTALPQYARALTGESIIEDLTWRYMRWYYEQMDVIYAPSESTRDELVEKGIRADKVQVYPRGIDIEKFHPARGNGLIKKTWKIPEKALKLLYVGRISREKNMHVLAEAFRQLAVTFSDVHLVMVGDGPYLENMKQALAGTPCTFTGYLEGDTLSAVYAACDLFVFPSTTDTFGNVILEAQASGLPVIVTDEGGPHENMLSGRTGLVVPGNSVQGLVDGLRHLAAQPQTLARMKTAARQYMEDRSFDAAFIQSWEMYRQPVAAQVARAS